MEEAPENGKELSHPENSEELSHSAHASGKNEWILFPGEFV